MTVFTQFKSEQFDNDMRFMEHLTIVNEFWVENAMI